MTIKKVLSVLFVFILLLSSFPVSAAVMPLALTLENNHKVTVPAGHGSYSGGEVSYTFTAPRSGSYAFAVSYAEGQEQEVYLTATTKAGEYASLDWVLFEAEAGEKCVLSGEYYGLYTADLTYTFYVEECKPLEYVKLQYDTNIGYVGDSLYMELNYFPQFHTIEEVAYSSSAPSVVGISYYDETWLELKLLSVGTATITVTTASGLTDWVNITVVDSVSLDTEGYANVSVPGNGGFIKLNVTPNKTGYYAISCDHPDGDISLEAYDYYYDYENDVYIYRLNKGETYLGYVYNWSDTSLSCNIKLESVDIRLPKNMKITKEPDNTTYLKDSLDMLLLPSQVMTGMEMEITWQDNTKTKWRFNEDGPHVGYGNINWKIEGNALVLTCGGLTAACAVKILDIQVDRVEVNTEPIRLLESDRYFDDTFGGWLYTCKEGKARPVTIHFSDGSKVTAKPGDMVYGLGILYAESQILVPWEKGGENVIVYSYSDAYATVNVELVEDNIPTQPTDGGNTVPSGTVGDVTLDMEDTSTEESTESGENPATADKPMNSILLLLLLSCATLVSITAKRKIY